MDHGHSVLCGSADPILLCQEAEGPLLGPKALF